MTLLDAYALIAFLTGGPATAQVRAILREGSAGVATANVVETFDILGRKHGVAPERTAELLDPLFESTLATVPLDLAIAHRAADLRVRHYHRSRCPISLADSILLASARPDDRVATADPDILAVAEAERIETSPLPGEG